MKDIEKFRKQIILTALRGSSVAHHIPPSKIASNAIKIADAVIDKIQKGTY